MKINGRAIKWITPFWFCGICWLIMSLAERLSSKFQVFLPASLLGRIFIFRSISQLWTLPAARKGLFTKLGRYETRGHWFWLWQVVLINALYSHKAHPVYFINIEWVECTTLTWRGDSARPRLSQKKKMQSYYIISQYQGDYADQSNWATKLSVGNEATFSGLFILVGESDRNLLK